MFHHASTALTTRAAGVGWTSHCLAHIQRVHRNLRSNAVEPSSPLQKLAHTNKTLFCMHTEFHKHLWVLPPHRELFDFRAQNQYERLTLVDTGISRCNGVPSVEG